MFGAEERVDFQVFEGFEKFEHAGDFGGLAAGVLGVLNANTLLHWGVPSEGVLECIADGPALVLVAIVEVQVCSLVESGSDRAKLRVE